jgi:hypothetical protein
MRTLLVLGLALLLCLAGCRPAPVPDPAPATEATTAIAPIPIPEGWTWAENKEAGVGIGVPPGWIAIDMSPEDFNRRLQETVGRSERLRAMQDQIAHLAAAGAYKILLVRSEPTDDGFTESMNIIREEATTELDLDEVTEAGIEGMRSLLPPDVVLERERVTVRTGTGERMRFFMRQTTAEGEVDAHVTSYTFVEGRHIFAVTFTTSAARAEVSAPLFHEMMETFRVVI